MKLMIEPAMLPLSSPPPLRAESVVRPLIGRSGPFLMVTNEDSLYIVKTAGNQRHPNMLANEFLGTALCTAVGLPVAAARTIELCSGFLERANLSVQYRGYVHRPKPGLHYASQLVGACTNKAFVTESIGPGLIEHVRNKADFVGMYLLDVCVKHRDRRQALFLRDKGAPTSRAVFIDHSHMFGGSNWDWESPIGSPVHPRFGVYDGLFDKKSVISWQRAFTAKLPSAVDFAFKHLPSEWHTGSATLLQAWVHERIGFLPQLIEEELDRALSTRKKIDATLRIQGPRICQIGT